MHAFIFLFRIGQKQCATSRHIIIPVTTTQQTDRYFTRKRMRICVNLFGTRNVLLLSLRSRAAMAVNNKLVKSYKRLQNQGRVKNGLPL